MISTATRSLLLGVTTAIGCVATANAQSVPTPSPSPAAAVTTTGEVSAYAFGSRADASNALFTVARATGPFRYSLTIGAYSFPVVGSPLVSVFFSGANTSLYGIVPDGYVEYVPNERVAIMVGKLGALLGQENVFTYENINIQRGIGWNLEPLISRRARLVYTLGKFGADVEINDGYYSGSHHALEDLIGWTFSPQTTL